MTQIDRLIEAVIEREGGYVDHPNDRGGPTKYGITRATLAAWVGRRVTADEVAAITKDVAAAIYYRVYYARPGIARLPEQLRPIVFDMAVQHDPERAIKILQKLISRFTPIEIDGIIGPQTLAGIEMAMASTFINALVAARLDFYLRIVARDKSQRVFLNGWINRAKDFLI